MQGLHHYPVAAETQGIYVCCVFFINFNRLPVYFKDRETVVDVFLLGSEKVNVIYLIWIGAKLL